MANRRNFSVTMNGSGTSQSNGGAIVTSSKPAMHASRTGSDFDRRKPTGQRWIPPTPYSMTETSWRAPSGSHFHQVVPGNTLRQTGFLPGATSTTSLVSQFHAATGIPSTFPSDLANRALINARNNLKDTSLDLGVAWGERRETARFVGDSLGLMANFLGALRDARKLKTKKAKRKLKRVVERIKGKDAYDAFKKIPSLRLQWQYAVKPLMSDIYGAVTSLDDTANDRWKVTVKGKANYKASPKGVLLAQTDHTDQCVAEASILYGCMVRLDVQPGNNALRKASQLGLTNPVNLAWELIPLSFVLDWAYPLGEYFSSLDAMVGWELLGYSSSSFTKRRYEFQGTNRTNGYQVVNNAWTAKYRTVTLARTVGSSVPFPMLPSIKDPRSHSHVADGLAILTQVLAKFK